MNLPNFSQFTPAQQQSLFELLILTMYADGQLTAIEDEYLRKFLEAMGYEESDRQREFDATVTRTRPHLQSISSAKRRMVELAEVFTTRQQHLQVYRVVEDMVLSDGHVAGWESELLSELRMKFRV